MAREPITLHSNEVSDEIALDLARAAEERRAVHHDGGRYLVQHLETHFDPGAGREVATYVLEPLAPDTAEGGAGA